MIRWKRRAGQQAGKSQTGKDQETMLKGRVTQAAEEIRMPEQRQYQILENIHRQIQERSSVMKKLSGKKLVLAAAMMTVLVGGTAIGAGKIAYLSTSHNVNDVDFQSAGEVMKNTELGSPVKAVEAFSDGTAFVQGYRVDTNAMDANGELVGTFPNINMIYENNLCLDVERPMEGVGSSSYPVVLEDTYGEIPIKVTQMEYLFLPPEAKPSEEDQKRQEAGELEISYGSSEEERKVYLGASWEDNGLSYLLFTMEEGHDAAELMQKAKEIIAVEP